MLESLIKMYNSGKSYEQIGIKIGKSKKWVMKTLRGHIVPRPAKRPNIKHPTILWSTKKERDKHVCELYSKGDGAHIIAKKLEIGKRTVFRILKQNGLKTDKHRKACKLPDTIIPQICRLYNAGVSIPELGKKFNVSSGTIEYHLRKSDSQTRCSADTLSIIPVNLQNEIIRMYVEDKLSSYRIASIYGWSYQSVQNFLRRKGLTPKTGTKEWSEAVQRGIKSGGSSLEMKVAEILKTNNIQYEPQYQLEEFRYDFALDNDNVLLEIQGSYWHSKPQRRQKDLYKQKLARKHSKRLLVIWDYQLEDEELVLYKVKNAISPIDFRFTDCVVNKVEWSITAKLLERWHYQGHGRSGESYGVISDGQLIAVVVFAKPTRLEIATKQSLAYDEMMELTRLVIHPKYQARNFATWLISRAIKLLRQEYQLKALVSFSDQTFGHDGTIYRASNWEYDGEAPSSYWYYHRRTNKIYHKKTIWNAAKKIDITESEYAKSKSLLKVFGLPKNRYIYRLK